MKTHGSGCTEAFFRGHVERETRLREGEDGQGGGKEKRRASMTELLRRIRLDGKSNEEEELKVGSGLGEHEYPTTPTTPTTAGRIWGGLRYQERDYREEEEAEEGGGREDKLTLQHRLEELAVSIEQRGRVLPPDHPPLPGKNASTIVTVADNRGGGGSVVVVEKSRKQDVVKQSRKKDAVKKSREHDVAKKPREQEAVKKSREQDVAKKSRKPEVVKISRQPEGGEGKRAEQAQIGEPTTPTLRGPMLGDEGALDLLTEDEKERFLRELASGRLGKLIVPWAPWWKQAGGVQEVVTGRTTHSLPPAVVAPCFAGKKCFAGEGALDSCSPTQPPTPEEPRQQKQQKKERQQQQQQQTPLSDLSGPDGGVGDGGGSSSASVLSAVVCGVAHPGEENRGQAQEEGGNGEEEEEKENKQNMGEKEKENEGRGEEKQKEVVEEDCTRHSFASLQNQACMAPDFSTLCAMKPSPALPSLAVDLAYAYVLAARLYNGCWCSDPVGASLALVAASPVLKDRATPATVGQALARCVERAVEGEGAGFRAYAESLRKDVLLVCSDPRKLICAFQDAWGMLEAAGRTLAPSNRALRVPAKKGQRRAARELGKVEKRVGYFLLWARSHGAQAAPAMAEAVRRSSEGN